ncbi:MAG: hypothetical protein KatS3mg022_2206 [Armatimonadota bacterium]|nr:MAG: hypothetical protein KatS3mg022_2206 [Armatimonadota bacterium]
MTALIATVLVFLTLALVQLLENTLKLKRRVRDLEIVTREGAAVIDTVLDALVALHVDVQSIRSLPTLLPNTRRFELSLQLPSQASSLQVLGALAQCEQVLEVKWD